MPANAEDFYKCYNTSLGLCLIESTREKLRKLKLSAFDVDIQIISEAKVRHSLIAIYRVYVVWTH